MPIFVKILFQTYILTKILLQIYISVKINIADMDGYFVPQGSTLYQDTGFQGFPLPDINIIQPNKFYTIMGFFSTKNRIV